MSRATSVAALDLLPLGPLPGGTLEAVAARLSRHVELPCHPLPPSPGLPLPQLSGRDQLDAGALLATLEELPRPDGRLLVGLTAADIAVPVFTFVFGLARTGGRASIVSLARVDPSFYGRAPDPALRDRRVVAEILHELGHLCGLEHCPDRSCLMSFAGTIEKADAREARFCASCTPLVPPWLRGTAPPPELF